MMKERRADLSDFYRNYRKERSALPVIPTTIREQAQQPKKHIQENNFSREVELFVITFNVSKHGYYPKKEKQSLS